MENEVHFLDRGLNERYNFRIYKNRKPVQRLCMGIGTFLKEILETVDSEEIYLRPEDISLTPPPRFKSANEVKEEYPPDKRRREKNI